MSDATDVLCEACHRKVVELVRELTEFAAVRVAAGLERGQLDHADLERGLWPYATGLDKVYMPVGTAWAVRELAAKISLFAPAAFRLGDGGVDLAGLLDRASVGSTLTRSGLPVSTGLLVAEEFLKAWTADEVEPQVKVLEAVLGERDDRCSLLTIMILGAGAALARARSDL